MEDALYSTIEIAETFPRWPHPHLVGFIQPSVGGGPAPSPLMLWWALLLSLSSLARYYPAVWVRTIDLDQSVLASPFTKCSTSLRIGCLRALDALRNHHRRQPSCDADSSGDRNASGGAGPAADAGLNFPVRAARGGPEVPAWT
jgi:hypothetical protein